MKYLFLAISGLICGYLSADHFINKGSKDRSAVQDLDLSDTVTDTDSSTQVVTVAITGANDASVVTSTPTGSVTEGNVGDGAVTASEQSNVFNTSAPSLSGEVPWWDRELPRVVDTNKREVYDKYHGNIAQTGFAGNPGWGLFFTNSGIKRRLNSYAESWKGVKTLTYFEAFGQSYCPLMAVKEQELGKPWKKVLDIWGWKSYKPEKHGKTFRYAGPWTFFDAPEFTGEFNHKHPRYSGTPATYPDGTIASGNTSKSGYDPRFEKSYDATLAKGLLGKPAFDIKVQKGKNDQELPGKIYIEEKDGYAGNPMAKKDPACPAWATYMYACILQSMDAGLNGAWNDNYGPWDSFGCGILKTGFGEWTLAGYRDYIKNNITPAQLKICGVDEIETFDIRKHLIDKATKWGWDGENLRDKVWKKGEWLDDPLWRAYLIYRRKSGTKALGDYYNAAKRAAKTAKLEETFLMQGNDIPAMSLGWARGNLDMVSTELSTGWGLATGGKGIGLPPIARYSPFYKIAVEHAKSRFVHIWPYKGGHYTKQLEHPAVYKAMFYEMLATHTMPKFQPATHHIIGDEETNIAFFKFVESLTPHFGMRRPVQDIGLYYSSSSVLRTFVPGGKLNGNRQPHQFSLWGWGTALSELHYQYRVIPEWKLTPENLASLRLLIIPNAQVLDSDDVRNVLEPWLQKGGQILVSGESGTYQGEGHNFDANPNGSSLSLLDSSAGVKTTTKPVGIDYYLAYENRPALLNEMAELIEAPVKSTQSNTLVSTNAPSTAGITLYQDKDAQRFFIDINNMNVNSETFEIASTKPITIELLCPPIFAGRTPDMTALSPQSVKPTVKLLKSNKPGYIKFEISPIEFYATIMLHERD